MSKKKTGLAKLTTEALLRKAATTFKAAEREAAAAMGKLRASVLKARLSGECLIVCLRRVPHGDKQDWLEVHYCKPYGISYRQAAKCIQIARPGRKLLEEHLPPGATINRAAKIAGKLSRGEPVDDPPTTPTEAGPTTAATTEATEADTSPAAPATAAPEAGPITPTEATKAGELLTALSAPESSTSPAIEPTAPEAGPITPTEADTSPAAPAAPAAPEAELTAERINAVEIIVRAKLEKHGIRAKLDKVMDFLTDFLTPEELAARLLP